MLPTKDMIPLWIVDMRQPTEGILEMHQAPTKDTYKYDEQWYIQVVMSISGHNGEE